MVLNHRYLSSSEVNESLDGITLTDYRGNQVLNLNCSGLRNGDLVAVMQTPNGQRILKMESTYRIDSIHKLKFINEMNSILGAKREITDIGYYYTDAEGNRKVSNITIH